MWWWCVESCSPHHRRTLSCVLCVCRGCCRRLMAFSCFSGCYSKGLERRRTVLAAAVNHAPSVLLCGVGRRCCVVRLGLLFLFRVSFVEWGSCLFRASFGYCSFFMVVQASVRFPNLPFVVGLWSVAFLRSAKGRAVVVDPVSG
ncbi:hypothetical protein MtrunA17_Chr1g0194011 [Medicago truncatula]|uniref:Uncharacterized protein n=1 Tax=Medicago truncatula TaxID=3880 RepID=A0A396JTV5_MEDTR|nr:hypothetical protein MtrunA17_Chr1g0194011 [Medicago truncatula]